MDEAEIAVFCENLFLWGQVRPFSLQIEFGILVLLFIL